MKACRIYVPGERWHGEVLQDGRVRSLNDAMCGMPWGAVFRPERLEQVGDVTWAYPPTIPDPEGHPYFRAVDPKCIDHVDTTPAEIPPEIEGH